MVEQNPQFHAQRIANLCTISNEGLNVEDRAIVKKIIILAHQFFKEKLK